MDRLPPHEAASPTHRVAKHGPKKEGEEGVSETITFNRTEFEEWYQDATEDAVHVLAQNLLPAEVEDPRLELAKTALEDMCNCAAAFQGRETIPASEFLEKAGPVVANAAAVLGQIRSDGGQND